jgi:tetratricopeptide (TPR) repeat protein
METQLRVQPLIPPKATRELQRSQTALHSGDIRSSAQHLEKALQIYPHYLEAHNNLGSRYIELHEYEKAAAEFQKAIDLDPRIMQPFNNLSVALFLLAAALSGRGSCGTPRPRSRSTKFQGPIYPGLCSSYGEAQSF